MTIRPSALISGKFLIILTAVFLLFTGSSCLKQRDLGKGKLMVVNAAVGFGPADVYFDGGLLSTTPITYPSFIDYEEVPGGTHMIQVTNASSPNVLFSGNMNIIKDINQSLFFTNKADTVMGFAVPDNFDIPTPGSALVRFFNLSPGSQVIDMGILNGSTFTPLYTGRPFETGAQAANHANFNILAAGLYAFDIRINGTSVSLYTSNTIPITAGAVYTIYLRGISGSGTSPLGIEVIQND